MDYLTNNDYIKDKLNEKLLPCGIEVKMVDIYYEKQLQLQYEIGFNVILNIDDVWPDELECSFIEEYDLEDEQLPSEEKVMKDFIDEVFKIINKLEDKSSYIMGKIISNIVE